MAEDSTVNQIIAVKLLEKLGLHSEVASNGLQAIRALENSHYDLVLMDVQMPEMDGIEATKLIRSGETKANSKISIIAMTANSTQDDIEICLRAGMDDYLSKPIIFQTLSQVLVKWLVHRTSENDQVNS